MHSIKKARGNDNPSQNYVSIPPVYTGISGSQKLMRVPDEGMPEVVVNGINLTSLRGRWYALTDAAGISCTSMLQGYGDQFNRFIYDVQEGAVGTTEADVTRFLRRYEDFIVKVSREVNGCITTNNANTGSNDPIFTNPGSSGGPPPDSEAPSDISAQFRDYPCARALVEKMKTLRGDIATLIKSMFGRNEEFNLTFQADPSLAGTTTDGKLIQGVATAYSATYTIGINPDVLNKATKEYILVTLYHEALHAYLAEKKRTLSAVQYKNQFTGYTVNGGRLLLVQDPEHWPMGYSKFVNGLSAVVTTFNTNFSADRATALAEGGIISLSAEKSKINKQERDTTDPVNNPGFTGTSCR